MDVTSPHVDSFVSFYPSRNGAFLCLGLTSRLPREPRRPSNLASRLRMPPPRQYSTGAVKFPSELKCIETNFNIHAMWREFNGREKMHRRSCYVCRRFKRLAVAIKRDRLLSSRRELPCFQGQDELASVTLELRHLAFQQGMLVAATTSATIQ